MSTNGDEELSSTVTTTAKSEEMVDITSLIEEAASSLTVSDPMLCKPSFSLLDSMSALEIMDQKMDCCELPASTVAPHGVEISAEQEKMVFPRPAPIGLQDPIQPLPWEELTLRDAAFIALEALTRLESMLSGASVVESIFTCLYTHKPVLSDMQQQLYPEPTAEASSETENRGTLPQHIVYTASLLLVEQMETYRGIIQSADIYEEEDFTHNTYDIAIFPRKDNGTALRAAIDVIDRLQKDSSAKEDDEASKLVALLLDFQIDLLTTSTTMVRRSNRPYHPCDVLFRKL
jgi:hypothetical protein